MHDSSLLSLSLFLLSFCGDVLCEVLRINNADELINFSSSVNSGSNYSGYTVLLESDIDFTGKTFTPVGNKTYYFVGTFDGQGYAINNLAMSSSLEYTGLFGYSRGTTVKNVVLDSTCTLACSYSSSSSSTTIYAGGVIGYCESYSNQCVIENNVITGKVSFNGDIGTNGYLYLGGISGYLSYSSYSKHKTEVKNCANYGSVTHEGTSGSAMIGGISGYLCGSTNKLIRIRNCLNYGFITNNNLGSSYQNIGGIAGYIGYADIEICVSSGGVSSIYSGNIGGIGGILSYTQVSNSYWDKGVVESAYVTTSYSTLSESSCFDPTTFELNESVSAWGYTGNSLLGALNAAADHYYLRDYSHWALNRNGDTVKFTTKDRSSSITLNSKIILLPYLASEGHLWLDGWYTDATYESPLESFEITGDKDLFGKWEENTKKYTITFDTQREGVSIDPITAQFGDIISLPAEGIRGNCSVSWWENDLGDNMTRELTVPAHNLILHAVWSCTSISSAADLVDLSTVVNSGTRNFNGATVFLGSDIAFTDELSQRFEPIGRDEDSKNYFLGTFDGQGHTISDLAINSSSFGYVGLLGYTNGAVVRNVVMDSSCSITSSYNGNSLIGWFIGKCESMSNVLLVENSVSMGSVTFNGSTGQYDNLNLGGIAGYLYFYSQKIILKNCANYGSLIHKGVAGDVRIGGLVGNSWGQKTRILYIQNCVNYGSIISVGLVTATKELGELLDTAASHSLKTV